MLDCGLPSLSRGARYEPSSGARAPHLERSRTAVTERHVVMFSSGISSWAAAQRVKEAHPQEEILLLFADVKMEDEDNYRFLVDAVHNLALPVIWPVDPKGRDVWDVFRSERFLGNTRADPCSKFLKRQPMRRWLEKNCDPKKTTVYIGYDWEEPHRIENAARYWKPWPLRAPLAEPPFLSKDQVMDLARDQDPPLEPPRLYAQGFPHANCGGFCVKAGQAQFLHLLKTMPDRYAYHEEKERQFRAWIGKDVAILRDRTGGTTKPLTLEALRRRHESGGKIDLFEWGGCNCMQPGMDGD